MILNWKNTWWLSTRTLPRHASSQPTNESHKIFRCRTENAQHVNMSTHYVQLKVTLPWNRLRSHCHFLLLPRLDPIIPQQCTSNLYLLVDHVLLVGSLPHSGKSSPPRHAPPWEIRGAFWGRGVSRGVGFRLTIQNLNAFVFVSLCVCMVTWNYIE